ncbi:aminotransferase class V-fold PLP-dependent enzyme [Amorphus orientalis]|uniref:Selenocysteine lyase/cysteine desulfurase n=1 Tax=Amorphus orientalis TaxID=649198 RepID=A0AAE3VKT8_9HYPH|nr:aminotransferase class V-fold PLP-dependent enzyme [Amorphus orientalis]MDQ0313630.1 selenocysteine lyase/cysteine desulfurase [Amorphus orientalis]
MTPLARFRRSLQIPNLVDALRAGLIGEGVEIETPFGRKPLLYADYVASGRALAQIEDFVRDEVLPFYANSHTEASFCGETMTRMRAEARAAIAASLNVEADGHVIFTGSGATSGINRIVGLLDIARRCASGERVMVLTGPYEHHSNILPWRECGAEVQEIPEAADGGVDMAALTAALKAAAGADLIVGSFSAASNVTGILTDTVTVTRCLKAHGAIAIWDYAGGGPYLPMDMAPAPDALKDAIVFSPHKFVGGPGASGVLAVRDSIVRRTTPTAPGGGSVSFVSPWGHAYSRAVEAREEAGTPNVIGDIRAALAVMVKDAIGAEWIAARNTELVARALGAWRDVSEIRLLGSPTAGPRLPIFSFQVTTAAGTPVHQQLFTRMLSDVLGIQARGGCACAGPYGHRLLGIDRATSERLFDQLQAGHELEKPGWVRLNLSYLMSDAKADGLIEDVAWLARNAKRYTRFYDADPATARFRVAAEAVAAE